MRDNICPYRLPNDKAGLINAVSAKFGLYPKVTRILWVKVFTRIDVNKFRLEREATVSIEGKSVVLDEIIKLKVEGAGL